MNASPDLASRMVRRRPDTGKAPAVAKPAGAPAADGKDESKRLSVDFPAPLMRQLRIRASDQGTTLRDIVIDALIHADESDREGGAQRQSPGR